MTINLFILTLWAGFRGEVSTYSEDLKQKYHTSVFRPQT